MNTTSCRSIYYISFAAYKAEHTGEFINYFTYQEVPILAESDKWIVLDDPDFTKLNKNTALNREVCSVTESGVRYMAYVDVKKSADAIKSTIRGHINSARYARWGIPVWVNEDLLNNIEV